MRIGKGAKALLIVIAVLIIGLGAFAIYVIKQPEPAPVQAAAEPTAAPETDPASAETTPEPVMAEAATPEPTATPVEEYSLPEGIYNILVVGTDSRTAEETEAEGLSDSMMTVSYNTNTNTVTLISFMRDSVVQRIGVNSSFKGKLNAAYKNGGVTELMDTLNLNFELNIDDYVTVGYDGFAMLVDELDGIDVPITSEEAYYINWRYADIPQDYFVWLPERKQRLEKLGRPVLEEDYEGLKVQHLDGGEALWYARNRTTESSDGVAGSDSVRINRQQVLMQLIYEKVKTEKNLDTLIALIKYANQYIQTDMDLLTMTKLGSRVLKADHLEFVNLRVPFEGTAHGGNVEKGEIGSGLYFDIDETAAQLHSYIYGTNAAN